MMVCHPSYLFKKTVTSLKRYVCFDYCDMVWLHEPGISECKLTCKISNPEEADLYFSDRMSAPNTTFGAPQLEEVSGDVKSDADGYLPDCE